MVEPTRIVLERASVHLTSASQHGGAMVPGIRQKGRGQARYGTFHNADASTNRSALAKTNIHDSIIQRPPDACPLEPQTIHEFNLSGNCGRALE
jgi:hypothetical protein